MSVIPNHPQIIPSVFHGADPAQKAYKGADKLWPADWTPDAWGSRLRIWHDASDASTVTLVDNKVSQLLDKTGNTRHATQGTAGNRPALRTINGLSALDITPGTVSLATPAFTLPQPLTVLFVIQFDNADTVTRLLTGLTGAFGGPQFGVAGGKWTMHTDVGFSSVINDDGLPHLLGAEFNGSSSKLYLDGAVIATGNAGTAGWSGQGVNIGTGWGGNWDGAIGETMFLDSVMSSDDLLFSRTYAKKKWGV